VVEGHAADWLQALQTLSPITVTETPEHFVIRIDRSRYREGID